LPRSCWLLHALLAFASSSSRATASLPLSPTRRSSDLADQQQGRSPDIAQGNETLPPGGFRPPRQQIGPQRPQEADRNDVEQNGEDRKSTRLNSSHVQTSYAVDSLKKKQQPHDDFTVHP